MKNQWIGERNLNRRPIHTGRLEDPSSLDQRKPCLLEVTLLEEQKIVNACNTRTMNALCDIRGIDAALALEEVGDVGRECGRSSKGWLQE